MSRQLDIRNAAPQPATKADAYDFLNTHPSTPERIAKAVEVARQFGAPGTGQRDKVSYLSSIDGLTYGDDPTQGFIRGSEFLHPRLGFTFEVPKGFTIDNTPQAILGVDGGGRALRLDTVKPKDGQTLAGYLSSGWIEGVDTGTVSTLTINGSEAATAIARGDEWSFRLYAIRFGDSVYRMIFAARDLSQQTDALFATTARSFRRMTQAELGTIRPLRIEVETVRTGDTPATIASRMVASERPVDQFLVLNGLAADAALTPGDRVKIVAE
jgi:predicted Zn-dependent protease